MVGSCTPVLPSLLSAGILSNPVLPARRSPRLIRSARSLRLFHARPPGMSCEPVRPGPERLLAGWMTLLSTLIKSCGATVSTNQHNRVPDQSNSTMRTHHPYLFIIRPTYVSWENAPRTSQEDVRHMPTPGDKRSYPGYAVANSAQHSDVSSNRDRKMFLYVQNTNISGRVRKEYICM